MSEVSLSSEEELSAGRGQHMSIGSAKGDDDDGDKYSDKDNNEDDNRDDNRRAQNL
jgi:hypothetical protein